MDIRAHITSWLSFIVSFALITCVIMLSIWIASRLFYSRNANALVASLSILAAVLAAMQLVRLPASMRPAHREP